MSSTEHLINRLASELTPVTSPAAVAKVCAIWLVLSAVYVVVLTHLVGPIRPVALEQLQSEPRFALEMLLGAMAAGGLATMAFCAAVPGRLGPSFARALSALALLWVAGFAVGIAFPALEPSMVGKRNHCYLETFLYALPPLLAALWWQRRQYALDPARAAVLAGLAAGILPALYMQVACMYQPLHILAFHVGPGLAVAAAAPLLLKGMQRFGLSRA